LQRLQLLLERQARSVSDSMIGSVQRILVEGTSRRIRENSPAGRQTTAC
jgi:hypothetical protein